MKESRAQMLHYLTLALYHLLGGETNVLAEDPFPVYLEESYRDSFTGQEMAIILSALEWALENRSYDFKSGLGGGGFQGVSLSNDELVVYMGRLLDRLRSSFPEADLEKMRVPEDEPELNVLIAEDSYFYGCLSTDLQDTPYLMTEVDSCTEAIQELAKRRFDLLLSKLVFQSSGNLELLKGVRAMERERGWARIPILVFLEEEYKDTLPELYEHGCDAHLILPVSISVLRREIYHLTQATPAPASSPPVARSPSGRRPSPPG